MTKKEQEQFRDDILAALKKQSEEIEKYKTDMEAIMRNGIANAMSVHDKTNLSPQESDVCICYITVNPAEGALPQAEVMRRATEVSKIVKPLMKEWGLIELKASFGKRQ